MNEGARCMCGSWPSPVQDSQSMRVYRKGGWASRRTIIVIHAAVAAGTV